ncbi:SLAP domain-containing protein [Companilactobacillus sp. HBUAS59699]|uniref:SLAP domain-containing protein n=1 Tax=Companilactobacillus sp. HBUAS59699 TaxID=3109358 RepID=UPI002FF35247
MNKKRLVLASSLAILIAPTVLGSMPNSSVPVNAATTGLTGIVRRGGNALYDSNGNLLKGVSLPNFTSWKLGSSFTKNGITYYKVATNQYVVADGIDITGPDGKVQNYIHSDSHLTLDNPIVTIKQNGGTVYNINGVATGRTLPIGSAWKVLNPNVIINGAKYYQVSGSEYVIASGSTLSDGVTSPQTPSTPAANTQTNKVGTLGYTVKVVDANGNATGVVLPSGSSWQLGKLVSIQGHNYYKVATNEYALAIAFKTTNNSSNSSTNNNVEVANVNSTVTVGTNETAIVNDSGIVTGQTLPVGTSWKVDQIKVIGSTRYYRVATNQWIKRIYTPVKNPITVTLTSNQQIYDTATNSLGRTLPNGSSWKVSKVFRNSKNVFWGRVSNNEWIKLSEVDMSYGDGDAIPSIAISEPYFALNF